MDNTISSIKCINCENQLILKSEFLQCLKCKNKFYKKNGVYEFIKNDLHSNFAFQWNLFSKTQLDSYNQSSESKDRLYFQSNMKEKDFQNKKILEVGSGAGRFTEILKNFNSEIFTVDYSNAIKVNYKNNNQSNILFFQADIFNLPFFENYFDIVICYGVIQHTGNNKKAIESLAKLTSNKNGILLLDIYSNSLKHYNPWIYLIRFFFKLFNFTDEKKYKIVKTVVSILFPFYLKLFTKLDKFKNNIIIKYVKYFFNRAPISVYGINLFLENKISLDIAKEWSLLDTYDAWMPKFDHPVSYKKWNKLIREIQHKYNFKKYEVSVSGQGFTSRLCK